jgi:hypothetical protein
MYRLALLSRLGADRLMPRIARARALPVAARLHLGTVRLGPASQALSARGLSSAARLKGDTSTELKRIHAALVDAFGQEKAKFADGKIELDLGPTIGFYSLSPEISGRPPVPKILLSSPVSGARWYVWDAANECWNSPDDGHQLVELFVREIMYSTSRYVDL